MITTSGRTLCASRLSARLLPALMLISLVTALAQPAHATFFTLSDANASLQIDTGSQAGVFQWVLNGQSHLKQMQNWYRVGNDRERSVDTLNIVSEIPDDLNNDSLDDFLTVTYLDNLAAQPRFQIEIDYSLSGGNVSEAVRITNLQPVLPLTFHFFEYLDFDLNGAAIDTSSWLFAPNTLRQTDGIATVEGTFNASHYEVEFRPATLNKLNDLAPSNLTDTPGLGVPLGPGDLTWAIQWDFAGVGGPFPEIPAGATSTIDKNLRIWVVPEPSSLALAMIGAAATLARRRVRR